MVRGPVYQSIQRPPPRFFPNPPSKTEEARKNVGVDPVSGGEQVALGSRSSHPYIVDHFLNFFPTPIWRDEVPPTKLFFLRTVVIVSYISLIPDVLTLIQGRLSVAWSNEPSAGVIGLKYI